jgi:uncharacterized protein (TIGR02145 family)
VPLNKFGLKVKKLITNLIGTSKIPTMRHLIFYLVTTLILLGCKTEEPQNLLLNPLKDNVTKVVEVKSKTGRIWMDRNLGASQVATSPTDEKAYGDLYQWGRGADGHQLRNSESTNSQSNNDESENTLFIISGNFDWRNPKNDNLWQGVNGTNNPCPPGFRIPTEEEWNQERLTWLGKYNSEAAFASPLKLTMGGFRDYNKGLISGMGYGGAYWSSTIFGMNSKVLGFNSTYSLLTVPDGRADGVSVRCIKD